MRKSLLSSSLFAWALAAVMAVALPGAHSAWAASARGELSAELPGGVTLAKASVAQTADALHSAVAKNPGMASGLTETALVAKTKSKGKKLTVGEVKLLVNAALSAAPEKSSEIIQVALSLYPQYADQLNELALNPINNGPNGFNSPAGPLRRVRRRLWC